VQYKLTQLRPFDLDIAKIEFKIIRQDDSGAAAKASRQKVIAICVPRDVINERLSLFQGLNIEVVSIEVPPLSLIHLSQSFKKEEFKDEVTLWIDIGEEESFIAIENEGLLYFSRNLSLASTNITKSIAQHAHVSQEEAEGLKKNYGLVFWSPDKDVFSESQVPKEESGSEDKSKAVYLSLISPLENFIVDIEHSFKYFSYQVTQSKINRFDRVILSGGGANLKNLDHFLSVKLGVPVERINVFNVFRPSDVVQSQKRGLINISSTFAVCAGLAMGRGGKDPQAINFLPEKEDEPVKAFIKLLRETPARIAAAVLILGILALGAETGRATYYKAKMKSLTSQVETAKSEYGRLQDTQLTLAKEEDNLTSKNELLAARHNLLKNSIRRPDKFSELLRSLTYLLPEKMRATKIAFKDGKWTLVGSTADMNSVTGLIDNLKKSDMFVNVGFTYGRKEAANTVYTFEVTAETGE
ncbi:MAG: pilus assembly protein PilM, partial [Candidatus Omnitrophica bacterium]|nr:pilus assembly protein PilM [Candidatus Omnitrophota bacterium]